MPTAAVDVRFRGQNGHERADLSPAQAGLVFEMAISAAELLLGEFSAFRLAAGAAHRVNVRSLSDTFAGIAPAGCRGVHRGPVGRDARSGRCESLALA
jgi:hypothetical protein